MSAPAPRGSPLQCAMMLRPTTTEFDSFTHQSSNGGNRSQIHRSVNANDALQVHELKAQMSEQFVPKTSAKQLWP